MKPLITLVVVFALSAGISLLATGSAHLQFAGNVAMCCMLFLTALGHFMFTKGMVMMLPPFIPAKRTQVYLTGILEPVLGIVLLIPATRVIAGYALIVFFILILPTNIYAAVKHLNMEKATYDGPGPTYLWFRVPEQLLFIGWVYYFALAIMK